jgi:hypothetical protein
MTIPSGYVLSALWYAASYTLVVMVIGMLIFSVRDLN